MDSHKEHRKTTRRRNAAPIDQRLDPLPWERLRAAIGRTRWINIRTLRKVAAAALILCGAMLALRPAAEADELTPVLAAARDLAPGTALHDGDVVVTPLPTELLPAGALRDVAAVRGKILAGGARRGEPLTDVRVVGTELARLTTGNDNSAAVPVRLADPGVGELLHPGSQIDVITPGSSGTPAATTTAASVIAVRPPSDQQRERLVVVALPQEKATQVATAALNKSVAITLR